MIINNGMYHGKRILSVNALREMQADHVNNTVVNAGEFVENKR